MTEETKAIEAGPKLGIFDDISNDEYHHGHGISKSGLDLISQSPALFMAHKRHPKAGTRALVVGQAFHTLVLEPDLFDSQFALAPKDPPNKPTKVQLKNWAEGKKTPAATKSIEFWERFDADNEGKAVLTSLQKDGDPFWNPGEWDTVHRMAEAVREHPTAGILLDPDQGKAEQSVYWVDRDTGKLCRCRPDFMNTAHGNMVVDLKSTDDASDNGFTHSVGKFRYFVQDAFYMDGLRAAGVLPSAFVFVAVEKNPPYGVGVYMLDREAKYTGLLEYKRNLELYKRCHEEGVWPCYPTDIRELQCSKWQLAAKAR